MNYQKFKKIWSKFGFKFECSKPLSRSLIKAANGDFGDFDKIEKDWDKIREKEFSEALSSPLIPHTVCKAIDLNVGDRIIHNYSIFKILGCGRGFGAYNEFGNYMWIKGYYENAQNKKMEEFWSFQKCPVIKLI